MSTPPTKYTPQKKQSFFMEAIFGALHPIYAMGYVFRNRALWGYLWVPCLVMMATVLLGIIILFFSASSIHTWAQSIIWVPDQEHTDRLAIFLYDQGLYLVIWTLGIFSSYGIGMSIAPIFAEVISDKVSQKEGWSTEREESVLAQTKATLLSIVESIISLFLYLAIMLNLFFLSFIPFVALVTPFVGGVVTAFFMSKELFEIPMAGHHLTLKQRMSYLFSYKWMTIGFGGICSIMALIPLYNFFVFPILIVGATLLYHRRPYQVEASS